MLYEPPTRVYVAVPGLDDLLELMATSVEVNRTRIVFRDGEQVVSEFPREAVVFWKQG